MSRLMSESKEEYQQRDVSYASANLLHDEQRDIFDVLAANSPLCSSDQIGSLEVVNETRHRELFHRFLQRRWYGSN